jgi:uncharacterized protein (TIGR02271 family)
MEQTVVGLFDDRSEAQAAMQELMREGFIEENIDLSNRGTASGTDMSGTDTDTDTGTGVGDRIANFFNSLFGDDETAARNYTYAANDAEAILTVHADSPDRAELARDIMDRNGAIDVDERGSQYGTGATGGYQTGTTGDMRTGDMETGTRIPVVEESLDVGKREVERGGARIRSRVVERPVEEHVRLREEHVTVNRRPVDREVTEGDMRGFQPGEMEITEHAEVPIVGKRARVVEEVEVGKQVTERDETVRDTVRGTEVDVEELNETDRTTTNTRAKRAKP